MEAWKKWKRKCSMRCKIIFLSMAFTAMFSVIVWGQEANNSKNVIYTAKPTLEYDKIENIGDGYFAAENYTRTPEKGMHFRGVYVLDATGQVVGFYDYNYISEGGEEGLYAAGGMMNGEFGNGFINIKGEVVIPLIYTGTNPFQEGLAAVGLGSGDNYREGFIDATGKIVVPFIYDQVGSFKEGLAIVEKGGKWGCIDQTGKAVIPIQYEYMSDFQDGVACFRENGKIGFLDKTGAVKIAPQFSYCSDFSNGKAIACESDNYFIINTLGKKVKDLKLSEHPYFLYRRYGDKGYTGFFKTETIVNLPDGDHRHDFAFYDDIGEEIPHFQFELVEKMSEGLAGVSDPDGYKEGYVDEKGNIVIPFIFDEANEFLDGYALVAADRKWGIIRSPLDSSQKAK